MRNTAPPSSSLTSREPSASTSRHTGRPVWHGGHRGEPELLASCHRNSLQLAAELRLASMAFPGISTGVYGYPKEESAAIAVRAVRRWLAENQRPETVIFVVFDDEIRRLYEQEFALGA